MPRIGHRWPIWASARQLWQLAHRSDLGTVRRAPIRAQFDFDADDGSRFSLRAAEPRRQRSDGFAKMGSSGRRINAWPRNLRSLQVVLDTPPGDRHQGRGQQDRGLARYRGSSLGSPPQGRSVRRGIRQSEDGPVSRKPPKAGVASSRRARRAESIASGHAQAAKLARRRERGENR